MIMEPWKPFSVHVELLRDGTQTGPTISTDRRPHLWVALVRYAVATTGLRQLA